MRSTEAPKYTLADLLRIMERLRDPETGCPWDLQQTLQSIAPHTLEECYELVDALERQDYGHLADELGDVLFQVVFYSQLGKEQGDFEFSDVVQLIAEKLLRRHPHVFADQKIEGVVDGDASIAEIKASWEATKSRERASRDQRGVLADVPVALPALSRAQKIQKRAATVGFDWEHFDPVLEKLETEIAELRAARAEGDHESAVAEAGDILFSAVNVARHLGCDAEQTLREATRRFEERFSRIEAGLNADGRSFADETLASLDARWRDAKRAE